jgi:hypothetical protein
MEEFPKWVYGPNWITGPEGGYIAKDREDERFIKALIAAWREEIARPLGQRQWFRLGEMADELARKPLAIDPELRRDIVETLVRWIRDQRFDLAAGEVTILNGDPPSFEPLAPLLPDASLPSREVLMLRRDAASRFITECLDLPNAKRLLRQWCLNQEGAEPEAIDRSTPVFDRPPARSAADRRVSPTQAHRDTPGRMRRGPAPGALRRYEASDRELFPEIDRIMKTEHVSSSKAALKLASGEVNGKKVEGDGTPESCAKRLGSLYRAERALNLPETR